MIVREGSGGQLEGEAVPLPLRLPRRGPYEVKEYAAGAAELVGPVDASAAAPESMGTMMSAIAGGAAATDDDGAAPPAPLGEEGCEGVEILSILESSAEVVVRSKVGSLELRPPSSSSIC